MGDERQSEGRNRNAAIPTDQWQSKGVDGEETRKAEAADAADPTSQPYGVRQEDQAERTGRTEEVTGESRTFKTGEQPVPDPNDLTGPAGDPSEGKRPPGGSTWPA